MSRLLSPNTLAKVYLVMKNTNGKLLQSMTREQKEKFDSFLEKVKKDEKVSKR